MKVLGRTVQSIKIRNESRALFAGLSPDIVDQAMKDWKKSESKAVEVTMVLENTGFIELDSSEVVDFNKEHGK